MANDSKKVSELTIATTVSANDRVVVLTSPNTTSAAVKTITVTNLASSLSYAPTTATFVPNFCTNTGNSLSVSTQTGSYTKFGKLCYFRAYVQFANSSYADGGGQYQMTVPFPAAETISIRNSTLHNPNTSTVFNMGGVLDIASNSTLMKLYYNSSASDIPWTNDTPLNWSTGNSSHFDISGIYETT
jgi:hypothetical protein